MRLQASGARLRLCADRGFAVGVDAMLMKVINIMRRLGHRRSDRAKREARAAHATVYVARDGAGRLIGSR